VNSKVAPEHVVARGHGVVRLIGPTTRDGKPYLVYELLADGGGKLSVPEDGLARALRPLVDRAEAERLAAVLRSPASGVDERPKKVRALAREQALATSVLADQIDELHWLYTSGGTPSFSDRRMMEMLGSALTELGLVLGPGAPTHAELTAAQKPAPKAKAKAKPKAEVP
jgi:RNA polymerase-interacting CarD/CdnL/TRCF family regulator